MTLNASMITAMGYSTRVCGAEGWRSRLPNASASERRFAFEDGLGKYLKK